MVEVGAELEGQMTAARFAVGIERGVTRWQQCSSAPESCTAAESPTASSVRYKPGQSDRLGGRVVELDVVVFKANIAAGKPFVDL